MQAQQCITGNNLPTVLCKSQQTVTFVRHRGINSSSLHARLPRELVRKENLQNEQREKRPLMSLCKRHIPPSLSALNKNCRQRVRTAFWSESALDIGTASKPRPHGRQVFFFLFVKYLSRYTGTPHSNPHFYSVGV